MVTQTAMKIDFTNELSSDDKFNLKAKLVSNYIRIFPDSFRDKVAIHETNLSNKLYSAEDLVSSWSCKLKVGGMGNYFCYFSLNFRNTKRLMKYIVSNPSLSLESKLKCLELQKK